MDIDLAALRALERERDISLDVLIPAIEQALLVAYHRTDGVLPHRPRRAGPQDRPRRGLGPRGAASCCPHSDDERPGARASPGPEFDDTPTGFGRVAAATARQVIVQRLRDLEDEQIMGDFKGREGDVVAGVIQQSSDPRTVLVDFGTVEGILPLAEQVPGERYVHGERLRCYVVSVQARPQRPADRAVPHPPQPRPQAVRPRGARDRRRHRRDRGAGPRGRAPHQDRRPRQGRRAQRQGRLHRPDGRPRPRRHDRAARREDRHRRLLRRTPRPSWPRPCRRRGCSRSRSSTRRRAVRPGDRARLPAVAGHRQGGPERPPGRQAHRLADRHPARHAPPPTAGRPEPRRGRTACGWHVRVGSRGRDVGLETDAE